MCAFQASGSLVFNSRSGAVAEALNGAADSLGIEAPRSLWHAVSFHTSGRAVQALAASGGAAYEPYWLRNNVFGDLHEAVTVHWEPYIMGETTMEAAALDLVRALGAD